MSVGTRRIIAASAIGTALCAAGCTPPDQTDTTTYSTSWTSSSSDTLTPAAAPPVPADFAVAVVITEQKCFGSAGCNYRYTVNPQYVSTKPLPDKTTVIFKVTGGDDDQIGNFTIDADGMASFERETRISGPAGADLQATVTQIIPGRGAR